MKVAIILRPNDQAPPTRYGGCGRVVYLLAKGLMQRNHKVTLYTAKPSTLNCEVIQPKEGIIKERFEEDIGPHRWAGYIAQTFDHIRGLELKGKVYDIINNHYDPFAFILGKYLKTPMLTTIHGVADDANLRSFYIYPKENFSALTKIQRDKYPENMNFIGVVHNAISVNQRDHPFSKNKRKYLFSVSRINYNKGQKNAIEIANRTGLDLILAGNKADIKYFDKEIKHHIRLDLSGLKKKEERKRFIENIENYQPVNSKSLVTYLEEITEQERDQIMKHAKALLFPIEWEEPFGLVLVEAGIVGTPILAFNRGAVSEIIKPGTNGFIGNSIDELVKYMDKVDKINPYDCRKYIEENFNPDKMVEGYIHLYEEVIEKEREKKYQKTRKTIII